MKPLFFLLLLSLAGVSCRESGTESKPSEVAVESLPAGTRIYVPHHPKFEFYVSDGPHAGQAAIMESESWNDGKAGTAFGMDFLMVKTEYKGSAKSEPVDYWQITLTVPGNEPVESEVKYDGSPKELWRDGNRSAGMRPYTNRR